MHALIWQPGEIAGVAEIQKVRRPIIRGRPGQIAKDAICAEHPIHRTGRIVGLGKAVEDSSEGVECIFCNSSSWFRLVSAPD